MRNARSVSAWCDEAPTLPNLSNAWCAQADGDPHPLPDAYPHPSLEYREAFALLRSTVVTPRTS